MRLVLTLALVFGYVFLSGCAMTIPVAAIGEDGRVLTGVNNVSVAEGGFRVSDGKLTCSGSYGPSLCTHLG